MLTQIEYIIKRTRPTLSAVLNLALPTLFIWFFFFVALLKYRLWLVAAVAVISPVANDDLMAEPS